MPTTADPLHRLADDLTARALRARWLAIGSIVLAGALLLAGALFFIVTRESVIVDSAKTAERLTQVNEKAQELQKSLAEVKLHELVRVLTFQKRDPPTSKQLRQTLEELRTQLRLGAGLSDDGWRGGVDKRVVAVGQRLDELDATIASEWQLKTELGTRLADVNPDLATRAAAGLTNQGQQLITASAELEKSIRNLTPVSMQTLYASIAMRVVAVALGIYLVQILVSTFRYYVRLANHFTSRADLLRLLEVGGAFAPLSLQQFAAVFTPDQVSFGKAPPAVTDRAMQAVIDLLHGNARR
jgi:hypothetical protein